MTLKEAVATRLPFRREKWTGQYLLPSYVTVSILDAIADDWEVQQPKKPKKKTVKVWRWESPIQRGSNGYLIEHTSCWYETYYEAWTKVPGSERVIEVDDE